MSEKTKLIRDIVFGYIDLSETDLKIIDTPIFQRLKRIKQLTAFSLYPSANQTRFEHSLGVMHLGKRVVQSLIDQGVVDEACKGTGLSKSCLCNTITYACLLHDVGHAPLSHVGERFYDREDICRQIGEIDSKIGKLFPSGTAKGSEHELMTCLVILKCFSDLLPSDIDMEIMCRMITKTDYDTLSLSVDSNYQKARWVNAIISILNSPFDVDRLDYVLRDSITTGTLGVSVDYERIVRGYTIKNHKLMFLKKSIPSVVNLITGRDFLYQWLYNHHIVAYIDLLMSIPLRRYFKDTENVGKYFSLDAVCRGVSDDDWWLKLRDLQEKDALVRRVFSRKFHKIVWKTSYDFDACAELLPGRKSEIKMRSKAENKKSSTAFADSLHNFLMSKLQLQEDDILVSTREVPRFDPIANRVVEFWVEDREVPYDEIGGGSAFRVGEFPLVYFDAEKTTRESVLQALK